MAPEFTSTARRLGVVSAIAVTVLIVAYAATLIVGLLSLKSPDEPIGDPMLWMLEVLIIAMMPAMVTLMIAVHAWAPARAKTLSLAAVIFMGALATITCSVHFVIQAVSRQLAFAALPAQSLFFSFNWPSVVYALDITAWDIFFPLSVLLAAPVFGGSKLALWIRTLMIVSGVLAFAGLIGVPMGDMNLRNIGIVGYVGVFVFVTALLAVLFARARPDDMPAPTGGAAFSTISRSLVEKAAADAPSAMS